MLGKGIASKMNGISGRREILYGRATSAGRTREAQGPIGMRRFPDAGPPCVAKIPNAQDARQREQFDSQWTIAKTRDTKIQRI